MSLAPVVLFTYKRLDTLKSTIESLSQCTLANDTVLYIFSDGARSYIDQPRIAEVRSFVMQIVGFKKVIVYNSEANQGLANSVINGVSKIIDIHSKAIVLEDDLVVSSNFLQFMNGALDFYQANSNIFSISAYTFPFDIPQSYCFDSYVTTRGCSWGWATWKDRWHSVDWNVKDYSSFKSHRQSRKNFSFSGTDLNAMLDKQMTGKIDSWAIRWYYTQFRQSKLTVYPTVSKVQNFGFDSDATHTNTFNRYKTILDQSGRSDFNLVNTTSFIPYFQRKMQNEFGLFKRAIYGRGFTLLQKVMENASAMFK